MAFSYQANPFVSQGQWDMMSANLRQSASTQQPSFSATYKPNPYTSQGQWNSMVPGFQADREERQRKTASNSTTLPSPPPNGVDMSAYRPGQAQSIQAAPGNPYQSYAYSPPSNADRTVRRQYADSYLKNISGVDPGQFTDEQIAWINQAYRDSMISHTPTYSRDDNGNVVRTSGGHYGPTTETFATATQPAASQNDWMSAFFPSYSQPQTSAPPVPQTGLAVGNGLDDGTPGGQDYLPAGTKIIRGPTGGFVFPGEPPAGYAQQPNGGYAPALTQPSLPQFAYQGGYGMPQQSMFSPPSFPSPSAASFPQMPVIRQPSFTVTQDPSVFGQAPELPQAGFFPQYTDLQGNVSGRPNYAQRDAFVDLINQNLLPYQTGQMSGPPQYDISGLLSQANDMAQGGYQNPFSPNGGGNFYSTMTNPLAGLFG